MLRALTLQRRGSHHGERSVRLAARLTLAHRLLIGFGLVIALLGATGLIAIDRLSDLRTATERIGATTRDAYEQVGAVTRAAQQAHVASAADVAAADSALDRAVARATIGDLSGSAAVARAAGQVGVALEAYRGGGRTDDGHETVLQAIDGLQAARADAAREIADDVSGTFGGARLTVLLLMGLGLLVALGVTLWASRSVTRRLGAIVDTAERFAEGDLAARTQSDGSDEAAVIGRAFDEMAERIEATLTSERAARGELEEVVDRFSAFAGAVASGDLTARLTPHANPLVDRLAASLNAMAEHLGAMSGEVRSAVGEMGTATTQILSVVGQHTASTAEQAASIAQTTATMEQLRATAHRASSQARTVATDAEAATSVADDGARAVDEIVTDMGTIKDTVGSITRDIASLAEQSHAIRVITQSVNDLADQSNLLALNATIEAARAGEHGRGFAVVAQEVRSLAERSKAATAQVQDLLGQIRDATDAAVRRAQDGMQVVDAGAQRAFQAGESIGRLIATIHAGAEASATIAAGAAEHQASMDEMVQAIAEVSDSTARIAAGADRTQDAAEGLRQLAARLEGLTSRYRLA